MAAPAAAETADEQAARHVAAVFDKFERGAYECQELLCQATSHWILSTDEPARAATAAAGVVTSTEPPPGIISSFTAHPQSRVVLLVPADDNSFAGILDMREVRYVPLLTQFMHADQYTSLVKNDSDGSDDALTL